MTAINGPRPLFEGNVLPMERSFYGHEDTGLTDELLRELAGILLWAIEGYKRLTERGHFVQPDSAKPLLAELEELSSPVVAFIRERCNVDNNFLRVSRDELHNAYLDWCKATGRRFPDSRETFGRNLRAALPHLRDTQPVINGERVRLYEGIDLKK